VVEHDTAPGKGIAGCRGADPFDAWFGAATSSPDAYLSTQMVRLAEDGAMFKIAPFEHNLGRLGRAAKSSEWLAKSAEIDNPNSEVPLTGRSEQLILSVLSAHHR
jgi:hypothetical protein